MFQPCAVLRFGAHSIMLDGRHAVWDFIDAVQPNMPKAVVNQGMKGEFISEQTFAQDLQDFINESDAELICFAGHYATVREPNSTSFFTGHYVRDVKAQKSPKTILSAPKSWGDSISVYLPMRMRDGVKWLPSLVVGDYPRLVIAQSLSESADFDLESEVLISSVVCAETQDMSELRPHATVKRTEPAEIISSIAEMHHALCDSDYEPIPYADKSRIGMRFIEIDDIEHGRARRLFISLP